MPFLKFGDVIERKSEVDREDALERSKEDPALAMALQVFRPRNWWGSGVSGEHLLRIVISDGLPLAWVPPTSIIKQISLVDTREQRVSVLLDCASDVMTACEESVEACHNLWLASTQPLAASAIRAWQAGEEPAAMALAVALAEDLAHDIAEGSRAFWSEDAAESWNRELGSRRGRYSKAVYKADPTNPYIVHNFVDDVIRGPIAHFFQSWWPIPGGSPPPAKLSRHVAIHRPTTSHYTRENSLLAVMLMTSFIREMHERYEELIADEYVPEDY